MPNDVAEEALSLSLSSPLLSGTRANTRPTGDRYIRADGSVCATRNGGQTLGLDVGRRARLWPGPSVARENARGTGAHGASTTALCPIPLIKLGIQGV